MNPAIAPNPHDLLNDYLTTIFNKKAPSTTAIRQWRDRKKIPAKYLVGAMRVLNKEGLILSVDDLEIVLYAVAGVDKQE